MADEIIKDKNLEETADAAPAPKRRGRPPKVKPQPPIEADTKEAEAKVETAETKVEAKDEATEAKAESDSVEAEAAEAKVETAETDSAEADSTSDSIDNPLDAENITEASEEAADCNTVDSEQKLQILLTPSIPLYRGPADKFRIKGASGVATVLGTEGEFTKIEYLRRGLGKQIGYVKIYE